MRCHGCHCRSKRSGASLKSRVDRREEASLLSSSTDIVIVGQLASMSNWHCSSRNATDARIMIMEVLLSVVVCTAVYHGGACRVLDCRNVVGRIRAVELGRLDGLRSTSSLIQILRDVLKIQRVPKRCRATSNVACVASLANGVPINSRHAVLGTMSGYVGSPMAGRSRFRVRRGCQSKVEGG